MRTFSRTLDVMDSKPHTDRLETPFTVGFRAGMSACTVIGRKLASVYNVPADCPDRMERLIKAIETPARRSR